MKTINENLLAKILGVSKAKILDLGDNTFYMQIISDGVIVKKSINHDTLIQKCKLWMKYNGYYFFPVFISEYPHESLDWIITPNQQASLFKYRDDELMGNGEDEFDSVVKACEFVDSIITPTDGSETK